MWADLFHVTRALDSSSNRPLSIKRNTEWQGSAIQQTSRNLYLPLFYILSNPTKRNSFLTGEKVFYQSISLQLPAKGEFEWILQKSQEVFGLINKES